MGGLRARLEEAFECLLTTTTDDEDGNEGGITSIEVRGYNYEDSTTEMELWNHEVERPRCIDEDRGCTRKDVNSLNKFLNRSIRVYLMIRVVRTLLYIWGGIVSMDAVMLYTLIANEFHKTQFNCREVSPARN